jgi:hypothetical protein
LPSRRVEANSSSYLSFIDSYMLLDAPLSELGLRFASLCGQRRAGGLLLSARFGWHLSLLPR